MAHYGQKFIAMNQNDKNNNFIIISLSFISIKACLVLPPFHMVKSVVFYRLTIWLGICKDR